jgi:hypothetical protein
LLASTFSTPEDNPPIELPQPYFRIDEQTTYSFSFTQLSKVMERVHGEDGEDNGSQSFLNVEGCDLKGTDV